MPYSSTGFRTTDIFIAGEDRAGREGSIRKGLLWIARYNEFAAKGIWKETIKPIVDKSLGGTLRLFVQKVYEGSYFTRNEETVLSISASMPNGTTLDQMNHLINRMEAYLSTYKEIRQFQTSIYNARQASINVYFTRENERSGFPTP